MLCLFQFRRPKKQMFTLGDGLSQIQEIEDCTISISVLNYKSMHTKNLMLLTDCIQYMFKMFKK